MCGEDYVGTVLEHETWVVIGTFYSKKTSDINISGAFLWNVYCIKIIASIYKFYSRLIKNIFLILQNKNAQYIIFISVQLYAKSGFKLHLCNFGIIRIKELVKMQALFYFFEGGN